MLIIQRGPESPDGTHGAAYKDGEFVCYTLERKFINNQNGISCILPGIYQTIKHDSPKHHDVWQLLNVQGRTGILIHEGNFLKDTEGCILVGLGLMTGGISKSQDALKKLRGLFPGGFTLEIRNPG